MTSALNRWLPWLVFAALLAQGATIGLTDDEAYYWVLAQRPALGYAFHPPMIGLSVALSQALLGWLVGHYCVWVVRLPAAVCGASLVGLGMKWIRSASGVENASRGGMAITAFAGLTALAWMIVPDMPMFLGWTIAFVATWEVCFGLETEARSWMIVLMLGTALTILSKYSGVLAGASSLLSVWLWAPSRRKIPASFALLMGGLLAAAPILWWNSQHEWASILYQVHERHAGAQISWIRYLRFWAVELVLMGPGLVAYTVVFGRRILSLQSSRAELYVLAWALPGALIFCSQPLWADFKPHWALVVWWPLALGLALAWNRGESERAAKAHLAYGLSLIVIVWACCHVPIGSWALHRFKEGPIDPRWDVTNDLYGWPELRAFVLESQGEAALQVPFVGSRYQTAGQAAFALGEGTSATLLPRDLKALDEWPDLNVSEGQGPAWPKLLKPVYYVGDNRYDNPPEYLGADCAALHPLRSQRWGYEAKTILLWKCVPRSSRP